jgi:hypothetical protein
MLHEPLVHFQLRRAFPGFAKSKKQNVDVINAMMEEMTPDLMDQAIAQTKGAKSKIKAIGDGGLLKNIVAAIKDFFSSPEGKAVLEVLMKLLLGLLIAKKHPAVAHLQPEAGTPAAGVTEDGEEPSEE